MRGPLDRQWDTVATDVQRLLREVGRRKDESVRVAASRLHQLKNRLRYVGCTPDRCEVQYVDPTRVEFVLSTGFDNDLVRNGTYVRGGDWDVRVADEELHYRGHYEGAFGDRVLVPIENYVLYRSFVDHFEHGVPWSETEFYAWILDNLDKDVYRYETERAVDERFDYLDDLCETIQREGFKRQAELHPDRRPPTVDEVLLDVGRDGRFVLDNGKHRFMIARILGLEEIPVRVFVRHRLWQRHRQRVSGDWRAVLEGESGPDPAHPDLRTL